jgi:hypothetical protein
MEQKLIIKAIVAGILLLFIGASVTGVAEINEKTQTPVMVDWEDNFDSYDLLQFLDGDPEDGGWAGWTDDPAYGSYVVDDQARSAPHSIEITELSDTVHLFDETEGEWIFTAWQYIPSDLLGETAFIMLNNYSHDSGGISWSTQITFDSATGQAESEFDGAMLPIIFDEWVEIRVEIDLVADLQDIYYGGTLLTSKGWSTGVSGAGDVSIDCVDLFANGASPVYYDDLSLIEQTSQPEPVLEIGEISGGIGVSAVVSNTGDAEATDVDWSITLDGGLIIIGGETTGDFATIAADGEEEIKTGLVLGIGKPTITIAAECAEGSSDEATATAFVLLFLVLNVQ